MTTATLLECRRLRTISRPILATVAIAGFWVLAFPPPAAGDKKLPTGEAILERYVDATGGKEVYARVRNRVTKVEVSNISFGERMMVFTIYAAAPNKVAYVRESSGPLGHFTEGCDGERAWSVDPVGAQLKTGSDLEQAIRNAVFQPAVDWHKVYERVECVGTKEADGKTAYEVVATPRGGGRPHSILYDTESGLMLKRIVTGTNGFTEVEVVTTIEKYMEVDDVQYPAEMIVRQNAGEVRFRYASIEHNVNLPKDIFTVPDAVKKLLEEPKANAAEKGKTEQDKP